MSVRVNFDLVRRAFQKLPMRHPVGRLLHRWLSAEICVKAIKISRYLDNKYIANMLDTIKFNRAMAQSHVWGQLMEYFDGTNITGIWRVAYGRKYYYMISTPGKQIPYPQNIGKAWAKEVQAQETNLLRCTRSLGEAALEENSIPAKRLHQVPEEEMQTMPAVHHMSSETYWDSSEARKLFGAFDGDQNVLITLDRKIEKLCSVNQTVDGYQSVIHGHDPQNICTQSQIFEIRQRCALLCMAYINAREKMNSVTWQECCRLACQQLNVIGITQAIDQKVIRNWNIIFRKHETFPHPNRAITMGKNSEPIIFDLYPDMK